MTGAQFDFCIPRIAWIFHGTTRKIPPMWNQCGTHTAIPGSAVESKTPLNH